MGVWLCAIEDVKMLWDGMGWDVDVVSLWSPFIILLWLSFQVPVVGLMEIAEERLANWLHWTTTTAWSLPIGNRRQALAPIGPLVLPIRHRLTDREINKPCSSSHWHSFIE